MAIQNDNTILNKGDLKAYHQKILPYLGGNMMVSTNNSEYYSTDEKVVGVWTDGKPLYQKTISFTSLSSGQNPYQHNIQNAEYINFVPNASYIKAWGNTWCIYGASPTNSNYIANILDVSPAVVDVNIGSVIVANSTEMIITFQYTKTTDTAGSGVTTPGAYDINFPNTWPENKEIYFGNGVYGQRFTGTITASINTRHIFDLTITGANRQPRIISCGGWWCRETNNAALNIGQNDNNQESSSILVGPAGTISLETKSANPRTNSPYDVWVTYTK